MNKESNLGSLAQALDNKWIVQLWPTPRFSCFRNHRLLLDVSCLSRPKHPLPPSSACGLRKSGTSLEWLRQGNLPEESSNYKAGFGPRLTGLNSGIRSHASHMKKTCHLLKPKSYPYMLFLIFGVVNCTVLGRINAITCAWARHSLAILYVVEYEGDRLCYWPR